MKKHFFVFLFLLPALWAMAQPGPMPPVSMTIAPTDSLCGTTKLRVNSTWPYADCSGGGSLTTYNVYTNFYLERSTNGTSGWTQVASTAMQTNNTGYTFTVSNTGYYRCRLKMTLVAYGSPSYCWNGSYTWEYLYTNVMNLSAINYQPVLAANINGNAAAYPTVVGAYNCQPITLGCSYTGWVTKYRFNVIRCNSDGTTLTTPNPYQYNPSDTWTVGTPPSSFNLVALTDIETPGFYRVVLELANSKCAVAKKEAFVQVSGTPSAASVNFKMEVPTEVDPTGETNRITTRPGVPCGPSSVGIEHFENTSSDPSLLSKYEVIVERVNCTGSENAVVVATKALTDAPGGSIPASLPFSGNLTPNGYFLTQCMNNVSNLTDKCYKVRLIAYNPCSLATTTVSYFYFPTSQPWFNCFKSNGEEPAEGIGEYIQAEDLKVYPNPATEQTTFSLRLAGGGHATLALYSLTGQKVWEYSGELAKGLSEIKSDLSQLPAALYQYRVETPLQVYTGKIIKQ